MTVQLFTLSNNQSNTIWVNSSLHLNTINKFQIRFKTRFSTKNITQRRFVTCFRNVATRIIAVSRTFHSSNQNVFCGTDLIVYHLTQTTIRFESLTIVFDDVIVFSPQHLQGTCRKSSLHMFWIVNTMECRMQNLNNDHYDYTYYQRLSVFMFFSFMIDYIKFRFLSKAIFTCGVKKLLYELNSSNIYTF